MFRVSTIHVELLDAVDVELFPSQLDLVGLGCELVGKIPNVVWEGCREQDNLNALVFG